MAVLKTASILFAAGQRQAMTSARDVVRMKRFLPFILLLGMLAACKQQASGVIGHDAQALHQESAVSLHAEVNASVIEAFHHRKSHVFVQGEGRVVKLLPDDNKGSRHQKFLVRISPEQTLLFAHNVDLAPRLSLSTDDTIAFRGEYIFNPKGGVMHWTHHDPKGELAGGWIMHQGRKYQ